MTSRRDGSLRMDDAMPCFSFFFKNPATTEIYTLSLHDALPISAHQADFWDLHYDPDGEVLVTAGATEDRKSTRLNSSHVEISYAVFCLKKKKKKQHKTLKKKKKKKQKKLK